MDRTGNGLNMSDFEFCEPWNPSSSAEASDLTNLDDAGGSEIYHQTNFPKLVQEMAILLP